MILNTSLQCFTGIPNFSSSSGVENWLQWLTTCEMTLSDIPEIISKPTSRDALGAVPEDTVSIDISQFPSLYYLWAYQKLELWKSCTR